MITAEIDYIWLDKIRLGSQLFFKDLYDYYFAIRQFIKLLHSFKFIFMIVLITSFLFFFRRYHLIVKLLLIVNNYYSNKMLQKLSIGTYQIIPQEQLGSGKFGTVYTALDKVNNRKVAVKVMSKMDIQMDQHKKIAFEEEVSNIRVQSPNIVKFHDLHQCDSNYYIFQELCDHHLGQYLLNKQVTEEIAKNVLAQLSTGMLELIKNKIVHRDLKPQNILLKNGQVKIADFGVSKRLPSMSFLLDECAGSIKYMSLEGLKANKYTSKCDIWSIGLIFYEMLHQKSPWYEETDNADKLIQKIEKIGLSLNENLSTHSKDFIKRCLGIRQNIRMNWTQFFNHPIFQNKFLRYINEVKVKEQKTQEYFNDLQNKLFTKNISLATILSTLTIKDWLGLNELRELFEWSESIIKEENLIKLYKELDINNDGRIPIAYFKQRFLIEKHTLDSKIQIIYSDKNIKIEQIAENIKFQQAFRKCYNIMRVKDLSIFQIFTMYGKNDIITYEQFQLMSTKYFQHLTKEQIKSIFKSISGDKRIPIKYDQFKRLYDLTNVKYKQRLQTSKNNTVETQDEGSLKLRKIVSSATDIESSIGSSFTLSLTTSDKFIGGNNKKKKKMLNLFTEKDDQWEI